MTAIYALYISATLCLTADPEVCKDVQFQYQAVEGTQMSTNVCGSHTPQLILAQVISEDYPDYFPKRWRCHLKPEKGA